MKNKNLILQLILSKKIVCKKTIIKCRYNVAIKTMGESGHIYIFVA